MQRDIVEADVDVARNLVLACRPEEQIIRALAHRGLVEEQSRHLLAELRLDPAYSCLAASGRQPGSKSSPSPRRIPRLVISAFLVLAVLAACAYFLFRISQPKEITHVTYQGMTLPEWVAQLPLWEDGLPWPLFRRSKPQSETAQKAGEAIRYFGPRAIPYLLAEISGKNLLTAEASIASRGERASKATVAICALHTNAASAVPELLEMVLSGSPGEVSHCYAQFALGAIGPPAAVAVTNLLARGDAKGRVAAAEMLRYQHASLSVAVPALMNAAEDKDPAVAKAARVSLSVLAQASLPATTLTTTYVIHDAARKGDLERVKALLKSNTSLVSSKDKDGLTPLHWAAAKGHTDLAKFLLASNAEVNAKDNIGSMPLHWAATYGHKATAELLLANKAEVDAKSNAGVTPFHHAAARGYRDVAELLLAHGAAVNIKDEEDWTALHVAAKAHRDMVELLLTNKAEVNAKTDTGLTPLHVAAFYGQKAVAELLLANQAQVNARNKNGLTPLRLATDKGNKDIAELLRQHGGRE